MCGGRWTDFVSATRCDGVRADICFLILRFLGWAGQRWRFLLTLPSYGFFESLYLYKYVCTIAKRESEG